MPRVAGVALAAERAPVGEAGGVDAAGGTGRRHAHAVCQPAARGAVQALTWRRQVVHLGGGNEGDRLVFLKRSFFSIITMSRSSLQPFMN